MGCEQCLSYSETLIYRRAKGLANFVRYNEVSLYRGSYNCITRGKENRSLYRGLRHIEVCYIEVSLDPFLAILEHRVE